MPESLNFEPRKQENRPKFELENFLKKIKFSNNLQTYTEWMATKSKTKPFKMSIWKEEERRIVKKNCIDNRIAIIQYAANSPTEDRFCIEQIKKVEGSLFAVFDGHGGDSMGIFIVNENALFNIKFLCSFFPVSYLR